MKKYLFLVLLIYSFGVVLRIVGQLINGSSIDWKATFMLGEFDNTVSFDKRWWARLATMFLLPLLFVKIIK
jgi:hypothetical protein